MHMKLALEDQVKKALPLIEREVTHSEVSEVYFAQVRGFTRSHLSELLSETQLHRPTISLSSGKDKKVLILDYSGEGPVIGRAYIELIGHLSGRLGIPAQNIILSSQNEATLSHVKRVVPMSSSLFFDKVNWTYGNSFVYAAPQKMKLCVEPIPISSIDTNDSRFRKFLCMNYAPRVHRLALYSFLHDSSIIEDAHFSFRVEDPDIKKKSDPNSMFERAISRFPEMSAQINSLKRIPSLSKYLDIGKDPARVIDHVYSYPETAANFHHWSIVTETGMQSGEASRFTEKSLKPICYGRPFIIFGEFGSLASLRDLGFETFGDLIDEGYDDIVNYQDRFNHLCELVRTTSSKSFSKLEMERIEEICEHNRKHLFNGMKSRYLEKSARHLAEALMRTI